MNAFWRALGRDAIVDSETDDPPAGSLDELGAYTLHDIHHIETYRDRGERQIRLYTSGYLRMVKLGVVRPDFSVPAWDRFDPWRDSDWPPDRDRR